MLKMSNHAKLRANQYHVPKEKIIAVDYQQFVPPNFNGKVAIFLMRKRDRNARVFIVIDVSTETVITVIEFLRTTIQGLNSDLVITEDIVKGMQK